MKKYLAEIHNDNDRIALVLVFVASMFLSFIPSLLVVLFAKKYVSESVCAISKGVFNFELILFLISLIFMIPVLGWLLAAFLAPLIIVFNVIIMIINLCALAKNSEIKIPVLYEFL